MLCMWCMPAYLRLDIAQLLVCKLILVQGNLGDVRKTMEFSIAGQVYTRAYHIHWTISRIQFHKHYMYMSFPSLTLLSLSSLPWHALETLKTPAPPVTGREGHGHAHLPWPYVPPDECTPWGRQVGHTGQSSPLLVCPVL